MKERIVMGLCGLAVTAALGGCGTGPAHEGEVVLEGVRAAPPGATPGAQRVPGGPPGQPPEGRTSGEPERFAPGVISDHREQYRITFTPSGDTAYFGAADGFFPQTRQASINRSVRVDGAWQTPEVAPFSGEHPDIDPFITPDGEWLYFSSIRPSEAGVPDVVDLWRVPREAEGWGPPERVSASTPRDDLYPSLDLEGRLYFGNPIEAVEGPGHWRVVGAQPAGDGYDGWYEEPVPIPGGVNTETHWAFNPAVSPDGRRLLFTRLNPTDPQATGFGELYTAHLDGEGTEARWSDPVNLGPPVNTPQDEFHPALSPDGRWLYFIRRDPFADDPKGDLYRIEVDAVAALADR